MCDRKPKVTLSELILAAVCYLQEKNGVTACEITEYVARKRCCKPCQIESTIKVILCKAKNHGILCEKKGLYRIEEKYDDLPQKGKYKDCETVVISDSDSDDDCDDECKKKDKCDPCACLKLSTDCLEDDEDDRCQMKKRKCG